MVDTQITDPPVDNQPVTDWKDGIHADYLGGIEKFGNAQDLAKSYVELEKTMGSRLKPLTPESSDEEKSNFWKGIGAAQSVDEYAYALPEPKEGETQDTTLLDSMKDMALRNHWSAGQWDDAVKTYSEMAVAAGNAKSAADVEAERLTTEAIDGLKVEWGTNYPVNVEIAQRAVRMFGNEAADKILEDSGLGDNPVMIKMFHEIGKRMMDDTMVRGTQTSEDEFVPASANSPEMYKDGEGENSRKARDYFTKRGYDYSTNSWNR